MFKYEIGEILRDKITGFNGVVMVRSEYYTGCTQYGLLPRNLDDKGKISDWEWIDEIRLETLGEKINVSREIREQTPGGPAPFAPEM